MSMYDRFVKSMEELELPHWDATQWLKELRLRQETLLARHQEILWFDARIQSARFMAGVALLPLLLTILVMIGVWVATKVSPDFTSHPWDPIPQWFFLIVALSTLYGAQRLFSSWRLRPKLLALTNGKLYEGATPQIVEVPLWSSQWNLDETILKKLLRLVDRYPDLRIRIVGLHAQAHGFELADYGPLAIVVKSDSTTWMVGEIEQSAEKVEPPQLVWALEFYEVLSERRGTFGGLSLGLPAELFPRFVGAMLAAEEPAPQTQALAREILRALAILKMRGNVVVPQAIGQFIREHVFLGPDRSSLIEFSLFPTQPEEITSRVHHDYLRLSYAETLVVREKLFEPSVLWPPKFDPQALMFTRGKPAEKPAPIPMTMIGGV